jgi:predicted RNA binding protein YcfA (HicA-like mRNA interferase family)
MPELRDIDAAAARRALERAGGISRHGKGDHVNVKMPNGQIVTFSSARGPVKVGVLRAMLKKADISVDQFLELLGRRR